MAESNEFICRYCGTRQNYCGNGPEVCEKCGASQPAPDAPDDPVKPKRHIPKIWLVFFVLTLIGFGVLWLKHRSKLNESKAAEGAANATRVFSVEKPVVYMVMDGGGFSPEEILNAAPKVSFPAGQLQLAAEERIHDSDDNSLFVAEVKNTSPSLAVSSPTGVLQLRSHGKLVFTKTLALADLAPGQSEPLEVQLGHNLGKAGFDDAQMQWNDLRGYSPNSTSSARLDVQITSQKLVPWTDVVNFVDVTHHKSVEFHGTVRNTGSATARFVNVYAVLHDAHGFLGGFEKKLVANSLPAGAQQDFEVEVEEWTVPPARWNLVPVQITPP
jgi:hypothetical protein